MLRSVFFSKFVLESILTRYFLLVWVLGHVTLAYCSPLSACATNSRISAQLKDNKEFSDLYQKYSKPASQDVVERTVKVILV